MTTINEAMFDTLKGFGYDGALPDMYREYLLAETGSDLRAIQDLERELLASYGYSGAIQEMWFNYLRTAGYSNTLQEMLYAFWNDGQGFTPFWVPLTHTAVPTRAAAGTTATFTRATTSTWQNNDGYLVTLLAGEIGFPGARRVRNLLTTTSEDFSNAAWSKNALTVVSQSATFNVSNGISADLLYPSSTGASRFFYQASISAGFALTTVQANSIYAKASGVSWIAIRHENAADGSAWCWFNLATGVIGTTEAGITAAIEDCGDGVYRCSIVRSRGATGAGGANAYLVELCDGDNTHTVTANGTDGVLFGGAQLEDVTAQTTQTAGEYVSVGALDYRSDKDPLYLSLPGTAGHYAATPDATANRFTGDQAIVQKLVLPDYTPAAAQMLVSGYVGASGVARKFYLNLQTSGVLRFAWITTAPVDVFVDSTVALATVVANSSPVAIGVSFDVDNGAAGNDIKFWYSLNDGATWTQLGATVTTAGVAVRNAGTAPIQIGAFDGTSQNALGNFYSTEIYNGIPPIFGGSGSATPVVDFNPHRDATTPTGTITSSTTGEVWTINGASSVVRNAAYHGSFVDGVKCFNTDIAGNAIPSTTLLGYQAEGARTNKCLYSANFNRVEWNLTGGNFTATDSGIASPIAGVNWQKLTVAATAATNILQSIVSAGSSAGNTFSVFMKKGSGANVANTFGIYNLTTAADVWFGNINYDTGIVTKLTGSGDAVVEPLGDNAYRVSISPTAGISAGNSLAVYVGYTGNPGTAGDYLYAIGAMLEDGAFASSYIATTTAAVTRNADVLTYSSAGNIDGTKGWCYAEFDVANDSDGNQNIILGSDVAGVFPLYAQPSLGNVRTLDGINAPIAQSAPMSGIRKGVGTWGGSTLQCAHNGVVSTTTAFDGNMNVTSVVRVGEDNAGNSHLFGTIRNVRIGQRQLSASELQAITS